MWAPGSVWGGKEVVGCSGVSRGRLEGESGWVGRGLVREEWTQGKRCRDGREGVCLQGEMDDRGG